MAEPIAKDFGIDKLKKDLEQLRSEPITIGLQGSTGAAKHPEADVPVAQVAAWMEYGTEHIPARPFLRQAFDRNEGRFRDAIKRAVSNMIDQRGTLDAEQERLGQLAAQAVKEMIDRAREWAKPLAAATVKAKGHARPLVDTGTMRESVSWAVRDGDTIKRQGS